jgi:hypothetical protein
MKALVPGIIGNIRLAVSTEGPDVVGYVDRFRGEKKRKKEDISHVSQMRAGSLLRATPKLVPSNSAN